ncbi:hypothetical protein MAC_02874 [Metarhizium acridum CQMa 102]|uniref:TLC domain-containing protein n=1 Tax=Metarhizium acridum (strain CQMa 102) TaxID=655827 RepID=E9DZ26_METAQ|nr:uncharacterized protein MAC_02874 [Metarhizium acridum CQMa 102]EFY90988.1 hypothetical protein MAC_02874 [Metarhizium acridum CQMa 102]
MAAAKHANGVAPRQRKTLNTTTSNGVNGKHHNKTAKATTRRKHLDPSLLRRCLCIATTRTWLIPLLLLLVLLAIYAVSPTESNIVHPFIFLSYKQQPAAPDVARPVQYGKGKRDVTFVCFYMVVLSFTRELFMQEIFRPLARRLGIRSRGKQLRFMEQTYTALYFALMAPFGVYAMRRTPVWYFNTRAMYQDFPHKTHEACFKFYYLFQAAYWAQQAIVMLLGLEKPRKDFRELIAHHIITISLIALSYRFHFTYMGIAVYLTHDISDFFSRQVASLPNLRILYSLLGEFQTVGPYVLNWQTQQYKCWISSVITFTLLAFIQALYLFWLFCLLRIGYRYIVHNIARDGRSEAEASEAEQMNSYSNGSAKGMVKT